MSTSERSSLAVLKNCPSAASSEFAVQHVVCGERHTLVLTGELDLASRPLLEASLARVYAEGTTAVVLDLSKLTFMDSSGIWAVLLARTSCAQQGCEFLLIPGQAHVQQAFEITGLLDHLPFQTDESCVSSELSGGDSPNGSGS